jgi:hypothetical protein
LFEMTQTRVAAAVTFAVLTGLLVACGGTDAADADEQKPAASGKQQPSTEVLTTGNPVTGQGPCQAVGRTPKGMLRLCFKPGHGDGHGQFIVVSGRTARAVSVAPPGPTPTAADAGRAGHWAWAALSPDRTTILAQWSAECEVPIAFVVDATGGSPRPVTGEGNWGKSPDSVALGWTSDGRAIVFLPKGPACGSGTPRPGIYLYIAPGAGGLLIQARDEAALKRSTKPRTVASLLRAAS